MNINVKLFAAARQYAQRDELAIELPDRATVGELRTAMVDACPALASLLPSSMIALNHDYAADDREIPTDAEVALIPPVSGG